MTALILTYHAVEEGPGPLFVEPDLFARHLDAILESGVRVVTVSALADMLRDEREADGVVAITFDDGFASVARVAAPLLAERGLTATVFCVAGHLGRTNEWPSQPDAVPRRPLATAGELRDLAAAGLEIGAHGFDHAPLLGEGSHFLHREVVDARRALEDAVGAPVNTFAYPYGASPAPHAAELVRETYAAACTTRLSLVTHEADPLALPRVDAHYVRRPELLRRPLAGELGLYLSTRFAAARARRALRRDFTGVRR